MKREVFSGSGMNCSHFHAHICSYYHWLHGYNTQQDVSVLAPEGFPVDLGILHVAQGAELEADECDV